MQHCIPCPAIVVFAEIRAKCIVLAKVKDKTLYGEEMFFPDRCPFLSLIATHASCLDITIAITISIVLGTRSLIRPVVVWMPPPQTMIMQSRCKPMTV